jgi:hypothetical protein
LKLLELQRFSGNVYPERVVNVKFPYLELKKMKKRKEICVSFYFNLDWYPANRSLWYEMKTFSNDVNASSATYLARRSEEYYKIYRFIATGRIEEKFSKPGTQE